MRPFTIIRAKSSKHVKNNNSYSIIFIAHTFDVICAR